MVQVSSQQQQQQHSAITIMTIQAFHKHTIDAAFLCAFASLRAGFICLGNGKDSLFSFHSCCLCCCWLAVRDELQTLQ